MGTEDVAGSSFPGDGGNPRVLLTATLRQAEALIALIDGTELIDDTDGSDAGLDALRQALSRSVSNLLAQTSSPADFVLTAANAVLASAHTDIVAEREALDVAQAAATTAQSVSEAALRTAQAASSARDENAESAAVAARNVADVAAQTATDVQLRAETQAARVATAAALAAETVLMSIDSGGDGEAALIALHLAATVDAAVIATAEETALAAAAVATAVAAAAVQAALAAAAAAAAFEREVANAAAAVRVIATRTARELAVDTDAKAVGVALAARRSNRLRADAAEDDPR